MLGRSFLLGDAATFLCLLRRQVPARARGLDRACEQDDRNGGDGGSNARVAPREPARAGNGHAMDDRLDPGRATLGGVESGRVRLGGRRDQGRERRGKYARKNEPSPESSQLSCSGCHVVPPFLWWCERYERTASPSVRVAMGTVCASSHGPPPFFSPPVVAVVYRLPSGVRVYLYDGATVVRDPGIRHLDDIGRPALGGPPARGSIRARPAVGSGAADTPGVPSAGHAAPGDRSRRPVRGRSPRVFGLISTPRLGHVPAVPPVGLRHGQFGRWDVGRVDARGDSSYAG